MLQGKLEQRTYSPEVEHERLYERVMSDSPQPQVCKLCLGQCCLPVSICSRNLFVAQEMFLRSDDISGYHPPQTTKSPITPTETAINPIGIPSQKYVCCCLESLLGGCCWRVGGIFIKIQIETTDNTCWSDPPYRGRRNAGRSSRGVACSAAVAQVGHD